MSYFGTAQSMVKVDAFGVAPELVVRATFANVGPGVAEQAIFLANAPYAFRVVDFKVLVSTAGALLSTGTLRNAAGGGGTALSDALPLDNIGTKRDVALTATGTVIAGGDLAWRRTDGTSVGEIIVFLQKI